MLVKKGANIWNIAAACYLCAHYKPNIKEKMKKFLAIAVLAVSLVACNDSAEGDVTTDTTSVITTDTNTTINVDTTGAGLSVDTTATSTSTTTTTTDSIQ